MKKHYEKPTMRMLVVRIERGFAVSDSFGMQQFSYDTDDADPGDVENTAW